jgi:hypothetical protein
MGLVSCEKWELNQTAGASWRDRNSFGVRRFSLPGRSQRFLESDW